MKKHFKALVSTLMVVVLSLTFFSTLVMAAPPSDNMEQVAQEIIDNSGLNATTHELSQAEYNQLWAQKIANNSDVQELFNMLAQDNYHEANNMNESAVLVRDNRSPNTSLYYISRVYSNDNGKYAIAMFIYNPVTDTVMRTHVVEADANGNSVYYESDNIQIPRTRNDTVAFWCAMTGDIACTIWGGMFSVVAGLLGFAVSLGCAAIFNLACL